MGSVLGQLVNATLVRGLRAIESVVPTPARLGAPLALGTARGANSDPVLLIGGFANSPSGWSEWKHSLLADGFDVHVFEPPSFGLGDMEASARAVAAFIEDVKRRTGRRRVDVVGFSEGGVLARMAVSMLGALGSVDRLVSLATPHAGIAFNRVHGFLSRSRAVAAALPAAAAQLLEGSDLLQRVARADEHLRRGTGDPRRPRYASIFSSSVDPFVTPWSSLLPGATNVVVHDDDGSVGGPNHFEMYHSSDRAYVAARLLLLDAPDAKAVAAGGA